MFRDKQAIGFPVGLPLYVIGFALVVGDFRNLICNTRGKILGCSLLGIIKTVPIVEKLTFTRLFYQRLAMEGY